MTTPQRAAADVAKVIAIVSSKGGSGKSTAAHLIAHGCGSLPRPVMTVLLTTTRRSAHAPTGAAT